MAEDFRHHWGQVYEPCNPDQGKHLIIDSIDRAAGTAKVSFPGGRGGRDRNARRRTMSPAYGATRTTIPDGRPSGTDPKE